MSEADAATIHGPAGLRLRLAAFLAGKPGAEADRDRVYACCGAGEADPAFRVGLACRWFARTPTGYRLTPAGAAAVADLARDADADGSAVSGREVARLIDDEAAKLRRRLPRG